MNIKQLEYLTKISKFKSLNEAANEFFITRQNLSYSMKALEDELGTKIFKRSNQGIEFTENGKRILKDVEQILNIVSEWYNLSENKTHNESIIIESRGVLSDTIVPQIMSICSEKYSNISISAFEGIETKKFTAKPSFKADSLITLEFFSPESFEKIKQKSLENNWKYRVLAKGSGAVFMNTKNPLAQLSYVSINDIKEQCIVASNLSAIHYDNPSFWQYFDEETILHPPNREATLKMTLMSPNVVSLASFVAVKNTEYVNNRLIKAVYPVDCPMLEILVAFYYSKRDKNNVEKVLNIAEELLINY